MSNNTYTQCLLHKGNVKYTAYLPTEYAKIGEYVRIKFECTWEDGWLVVDVFTSLPFSYVIERSQDYRKTRTASDI